MMKERLITTGTVPSDLKDARAFATRCSAAVCTLSTLSLILRFIARRKIRKLGGAEDYLILVSYIISLVPVICIYLSLRNGLGYYQSNLESDTFSKLLKIDFVLQRTFYPAAAAAKVSILIWYTSLFTMKVFVYIAWGEIILVLSWALAATVWGLVTCQPVSYLWDGLASSTSTTTAGGYCSDADPLTADLTFAVWDVATSVAILVLPMVVLPRLPRRLLSMWRRAAVLALFLLGSLACIIGGVRISAIYQHHEALRPRLDDEYTNSEAYLATWIVIEVHAAILSSNLPCLAPLFPCLRVRDSEGDDESFIGVGDPERAWPKSSSNNQSNNSNGSARRPTVRFADEYPLLHYPLPPIHTGGPIWQPGDFRSRGRATDGSTRSDHRMEYSRKTSTVEVIPVSSGSE